MELQKQGPYRRDPFAVDPVPRAHYYPSPERRLTKDQKMTAISPSRKPTVEKHSERMEETRLSPMDEIFLHKTNMYQPKMTAQYDEVDTHDDKKFDESWPSSEQPSSMNLTGLEEGSPMNMERFQAAIDRFTDLKKNLSFPEHESPGTSPQLPRRTEQRAPQKEACKKVDRKTGIQTKSQIPVRDTGKTKVATRDTKVPTKLEEDSGGGSVLQRYIERFRNSAPLSREERERQKENSSKDFWWLSSGPVPAPAVVPSGSLTPREEENGGKTSCRITPLTTDNLDKYSNLQKLRQNGYQRVTEVQASPGDRKTRELQERAEKLLERSSSSVVSTEPAVSTEGLGSNTSGMSSLEEYSYRPKFTQFLDKEDQHKSTANPYTYKSDMPAPRIAPPCPEDDPLHQWRLRRRMEQAQESAPKNVQSFGFLSKTEQQKKIDSQLEGFKRKLAGKDSSSKTSAPSYQFTPAPIHQQAPESEPHIASPTLHRRKPQTSKETEVDPHLHLMCDLLPCPHRGQYDNTIRSLQSDKTSTGFTAETQRPNDTFSKTEKQRQNEILSPRDVSASDKEKTQHFQHDKFSKESEFVSDTKMVSKSRQTEDECDRKYKQYLEAEKPDVERSDSERSIKSERSTRSDRSSKSDRSKRDKVKKRNKGETESVEVVVREDKQLDNREIGKETESKDDRVPRLSKNLIKDDENEMPPHQVQRSRDGRSRSEDTRKEKLRPRLSSSPKRNVDEAIGQVVKNHLFSMSTSTVISSVESLPPSASVEGLPRLPEHIAEEPDTRQEADSYESDGEFSDDHLLQMLRKQRSQYELQLREIDAVLATLDQR